MTQPLARLPSKTTHAVAQQLRRELSEKPILGLQDVQAAAAAMVAEYGSKAGFEAAAIAGERLSLEDAKGVKAWLRIIAAIRELEGK